MQILITGGTGMLGSSIARLAISAGHQVCVTYQPGDPLTALEGLEPLEHRPADLLDSSALDRAVEQVEAVIHTAAMVSFQPGDYERQMAVNVEGTRGLLAAARRAGVRRLVHTSTVNTLGVPPADSIGDESTPFDWQRYRLGYMDSKRGAESLVLEAAARADADGGLDCVCALPGTFFGSGDVNLNASSYIMVVQRLRGRWVALPGGTSVVHVDDVARGHLLALERGKRGERYILGGEPVSYAELDTFIAEVLGYGHRRGLVVPAWPLLQAGRASSWLRDRVRLPLPLTEGLVAAGCAKLYYSSARAEQELGWSFRPWREAIRDAVAWLRETGKL
jgi:dihydroflavonol-4-reductase